MKRAAILLVLLLAGAGSAVAQAPWREGATELGVISGGGPAIVGGRSDRGFWLVGGRWGRQLTADRGKGWMRGHVQYAIEAIPVYFQFQSDTVYGAGLTPIMLRYQLTSNRTLAPFVEAGAGILATMKDVPEGTANFNFTPQAGIGVQYITARQTGWTLGVRYHHTSNAGIARHNPGINAVMIYAAVSWFR